MNSMSEMLSTSKADVVNSTGLWMALVGESGVTGESPSMGSPDGAFWYLVVLGIYHAVYLQTEEKGKVGTITGS